MVSELSELNIAAQSFMTQITSSMSHQMVNLLGGGDPHQAAVKLLVFRVHNQVFMLSFLELIQTMMVVIAFSIIPIYFMKIKRGPTKIVDAH